MRAAFSLLFLVTACPKPLPADQPVHSGIVDCSLAAVRDHALEALPRVNDCLVADVDVTACLLGLVEPALHITVDVVACVARASGDRYAETVTTDPVSRRAAKRAREFTSRYTFVSPP